VRGGDELLTASFTVISPLQILVIRRDNIGDLICTTPLLHGLRKKHPTAVIAVLASSYNAEVLRGNPDVDEVFVFLKRHQKSHGYGRLAMLWKRWRLVRTLRKRRFDHIILANGGWRYAKTLGGKEMIGFHEPGQPDRRQPDRMPPHHEGIDEHEVSKIARLGSMLGVQDAVGKTWIFPEAATLAEEVRRLRELGWDHQKPTCAIHISSRNMKQRWPEQSFVALAKELLDNANLQLLLFWSPGNESSSMHPGDDEKAAQILAQLQGRSIYPCPTKSITELIAAISLVDQVICSDGGAMHVAAALGKPILCFFGPTPVNEWHPWGVPYIVLQPPSKEVQSISVDEALKAYGQLNDLSRNSTHYLESPREPLIKSQGGR
jgi:ADP-heptose:LPS heptosyltransferase